jgi:hypothetical protein
LQNAAASQLAKQLTNNTSPVCNLSPICELIAELSAIRPVLRIRQTRRFLDYRMKSGKSVENSDWHSKAFLRTDKKVRHWSSQMVDFDGGF